MPLKQDRFSSPMTGISRLSRDCGSGTSFKRIRLCWQLIQDKHQNHWRFNVL